MTTTAPTAAENARLPTAAQLEEQELIGRIREHRARRLTGSSAAAISALLFLVAATALAVVSHAPLSLAALALLVAAFAATCRVEFEIGSGTVMPSQLVLVPMLLTLPAGLVPLAVAVAIVLSQAPELVRRRLPLDQVLLYVANAWYAVGPVVVLLAFGETHGPRWAAWPVYLLALAVQFTVNFASALAPVRIALGLRPRELVRLMAPAFVVDAALAPLGLALAFQADRRAAAVLVVLPLVALLGVFARDRQQRIDHALELSHAYRGTALLLGDVIEADDAYTGSHSRDVVELALAVADRLGLDAAARRETEFAALLHDVGKVRIPAEIINKPGPLDAEERARINMHTIEGEQMLERVGGLLGHVGRIVRSCHERWDGGGYPDGLAGEAIPLGARIVCCCDAFNAMTTDRPYRGALSLAEATEELSRNRGGQFDAAVVDALLAVVA